MSECFRHNMEAFKLPIDGGFDLVVTRASQHIGIDAPQGAPASLSPIYLQVKSLQIFQKPVKEGARDTWPCRFRIKATDIDLLCRVPNSALVCVAFMEDKTDYSLSRTAYTWWIPSELMVAMRRNNYFLMTAEVGVCEFSVELRRQKQMYVAMRRANRAGTDIVNGYTVDKAQFDFGSLCAPKLAEVWKAIGVTPAV
jgi:hypothetical protein